jgi:hypothetical protein
MPDVIGISCGTSCAEVFGRHILGAVNWTVLCRLRLTAIL